jgi:transcriptional regulator with XRE-family HTH domain|tara:strand:- start:98 stop:337 length:240 start_codon:yes stop_codon:yes gene_type:complete
MSPTEPNSIDKEIGARLKRIRVKAGMSQTHVATAIGVSFQQLQKYETAANRISVSKLVMLAKALDTPVSILVYDLEKYQ